MTIGSSLGGTHALEVVLKQLPKNFGLPIVCVQHRGSDGSTMVEDQLVALLQRHTELLVSEAEDKEPLAAGHVYLAPADYHLLVDKNGFHLSTDAPVCHARPSIDVLFESAAESFGGKAVGVILTGASDDGSNGAAHLEAEGALLLVQDPETAEAETMPRAALARLHSCRVLSLAEIGILLPTLNGETQ